MKKRMLPLILAAVTVLHTAAPVFSEDMEHYTAAVQWQDSEDVREQDGADVGSDTSDTGAGLDPGQEDPGDDGNEEQGNQENTGGTESEDPEAGTEPEGQEPDDLDDPLEGGTPEAGNPDDSSEDGTTGSVDPDGTGEEATGSDPSDIGQMDGNDGNEVMPDEEITEFPAESETVENGGNMSDILEWEQDKENPETDFSSGDGEAKDGLWSEAAFMAPEAAAARSGITLKKVNADTKMNQDYAFTYAFRKGVTSLKSISRYNGTLNERIHNWFGDENGYSQAYCSTFYAARINDTDYSDPISVLYSNVGEYQGQTVDLKVTAVSWGMVNNNHIGLDGTRIIPCVLFYKDRIAFNTISVGTVRFRFEFYRHGTETKINPKGHVTMADLDGGQGFRIYDSWGVEGLYIRDGYDHLKGSNGTSAGGDSYLELRGAEGVSTTNSDPKGWCQVDFNGTFTVNWLAQKSWSTGTGPTNAFFVSTSLSVGTYEPNPAPEKRVGDAGTSFANMEQHNSENNSYGIYAGKNFDYIIAQRLLPGNYSSFEVTDTLDGCLDFRTASVQTAGGQDVTKYFTVSRSGNTVKFSAGSAFLKTDEAMNDVTYYFRINVTAKDNETIAAHDHYRSSVYYIKNTARRRIVSSVMNDVQSANETYVSGSITGSCSVKKIDGDTAEILEGAEFDLYQWDREQNKYVFLRDMAFNAGNKLYESGTLTYTAQNLGKFRIVETKAPENYDGNWQKDIQAAGLGTGIVYEAVNNRTVPLTGEITVTKKIKENDIIWAHGNPVFRFRVEGTDIKGKDHTYEDYVEFQKDGYETEDGYAVLSCVFRNIPVGNYTVSELETLRYDFESVNADTQNVSVSGERGIVRLEKTSPQAGVTFVNIKTVYDRYSHTDVIRNRIPVIA